MKNIGATKSYKVLAGSCGTHTKLKTKQYGKNICRCQKYWKQDGVPNSIMNTNGCGCTIKGTFGAALHQFIAGSDVDIQRWRYVHHFLKYPRWYWRWYPSSPEKPCVFHFPAAWVRFRLPVIGTLLTGYSCWSKGGREKVIFAEYSFPQQPAAPTENL